MINIFRNLFSLYTKNARIRNTQSDLFNLFLLNMKAGGGSINISLPNSAGSYKDNVLKMLINHHLQKWNYNCDDDFDWIYLEKRLLFYGQAIIFKRKNEIIITGFVVKKWFYNFKSPRIVSPIFFGKDDKIEKTNVDLEVGKDCVIIYNDETELHHKVITGPILRYANLIDDLAQIYENIYANLSVMNPKLVVEGELDENHLKKVEKDLKNPQKLTIKLGNVSDRTDLGGRLFNNTPFKSKDAVINFEDKTSNLWYNFDRVYGELKEKFGISNNVNPGKKERTTNKELEIDSTISDAVNNFQLMMRKKMEKDLKKLGIKINVDLKKEEKQNKEKEINNTEKITKNE